LSFNVKSISYFDKQAKKLSKKYPSFMEDGKKEKDEPWINVHLPVSHPFGWSPVSGDIIHHTF